MCRRVEFTDVEIFKFRVFRIRGVLGFRGTALPTRPHSHSRARFEREKERKKREFLRGSFLLSL